MTTTTVENVRYGPLMYGKRGFSARILTETHALGVSRYDDETDWTVDSVTVRANSYPVYANGVGSRCCALRKVADPDMIRLLDEATDGPLLYQLTPDVRRGR